MGRHHRSSSRDSRKSESPDRRDSRYKDRDYSRRHESTRDSRRDQDSSRHRDYSRDDRYNKYESSSRRLETSRKRHESPSEDRKRSKRDLSKDKNVSKPKEVPVNDSQQKQKDNQKTIPKEVPTNPKNTLSLLFKQQSADNESPKVASPIPASSPVPTNVNSTFNINMLTEFEKQLQETLATITTNTSNTTTTNVVKGLSTTNKRVFRIDSQGREVDEDGHVISSSVIKPEATLLINRNKQQSSSLNPYLSHMDIKPRKKGFGADIVDPSIHIRNRDNRGKKGLQFVAEGSISRKADQIRNKYVRELISQETTQGPKEEDIQINTNFAPVEPVSPSTTSPTDKTISPALESSIPAGNNGFTLPPPLHNPVPQFEWWDRTFLPEDLAGQFKSIHDVVMGVNYDMCSLENCETKELVHHPVPIERNKEDDTKVLPIMQTKQERKKIRRQHRAERVEEQRLRIQAELEPAPAPKLNMRNYRLILKDEAIANPSATEMMVKKQIEARKQAHEQRNQEGKLTAEEKRAKMIRKIIGDKTGDTYVAVYRVNHLDDPRIQFKVTVNANQNHLTGIALTVPTSECCCIYVEGTKKSIKRYHKLMTRRIQWSENNDDEEEEEEEEEESEDNNNNNNMEIEDGTNTEIKSKPKTKKNGCVVIWQGISKKPFFTTFNVEVCKTNEEAHKLMEMKGLVQHWDACINYKPEVNSLF
ncbi:hypothetical protein WA158_007548 [Blastocystis sp. Blastoise]